LPEISIALLSSHESPELSLGNLIGASIVILTLIIGISAVKYKGIEFKGKFSEKEVILGLGIISAMVLALADQAVGILDSVVLIIGYGVFVYYLYKKFNGQKMPAIFLDLDSSKPIKLFLRGLVGITGIILASAYIVDIAGKLALGLGVSESVIGILMLAIGTNLPEISILLTSKNLEEEELAVGGFLGSACVNAAVLGILGLTSQGFKIEGFVSIVSGSVILLFSILLFIIFSWTGKKLSRSEGILLISAYAAFLITEIVILINQSQII